MKFIMTILLLVSQLLNIAQANAAAPVEKPKIMFETKIYLLQEVGAETTNIDAQMANAVLESSPSLLTIAGGESSLKIAANTASGEQQEIIMMNFMPDATGKSYDVKLELLDADNTVISHIKDAAMDKPLNFSAKLNNVTRLFSVKATQVNFMEDNVVTAADTIPASLKDDKQCGRVSVFFTPKRNERFFIATIYKVNGKNVDATKTTHRLPVGKNTLSISNSGGSFSAGPIRYRGHGKELEIIVEPDTNYHIGAKFVGEKRYRTREQENWEPVVWKTTKQDCSF